MTTRLRGVLALGVSLIGSVVLAALPPVQATASTSAWLDRLNAWRAIANLLPLTENTTYSAGDYNHSLYMVKNDQVTHYEVSTLPYYTVAGDTAARNGNIQVSSMTSTTDEQSIDWWMAAPFHALGMMDPRLTSTGFGSYREVKSGWQAGFTLDTLRGNSFTGGTYPVFFPGNGSSEPLRTYNGGETPDPLQACPGYSVPTGLPVFIEVGGNVATSVTAHTFTGNGSPLAHCVIDSNSPSVGSNLTSRGAVIVVPQAPLQPGVQYVVALTVNAVPYTWTFTVSTSSVILPSGWTTLDGVATSGTGSASTSAASTEVVVRGTDNGLWHRTWNGTQWGPWSPVGGVLSSGPGAVAQSTKTYVFVRGSDNQLWTNNAIGGVFGNWQPLGGVLTSGPAGDQWTGATSHLDVFARGTDGQLWHKWGDNGTWYFWEPLGGGLNSDPGAVSWGPSRIDVFVRGTDNQLWHKSYSPGSWSTWEPLGGVLTSGPAVASCASGHLDVFVVGSDGQVWRKGFNGAWSNWQPLSGWGVTGLSAVCPATTTTIQLFGHASDGTVLQSTATAS